jgi:hypothetical protein
MDQRVLLLMRQPTEIGKLGHPQLESRASWSRQAVFKPPKRTRPNRG